jgi:hypothetical protein
MAPKGQYGRRYPERRVLAQMASPDGRTPPVLWIYRCQVVLSSPHPVSESLQRLAEVTTSRRATDWYLHQWAPGRPDPRFWGEVDQVRVRLTRFPDRNTEFIPVLDARPGAAANGGTTLSGWVGDDNSAAFAILFSAAWFGVVTSALLGVGIALLVSGHLIGLALAVAFPLPAAWYVRAMLKNRQPRGRRISEFLESVNEVLGSTAAFPGAPAIPAASSNARRRWF